MDVDFKKLADEERKRKERDMWGDVEKEKHKVQKVNNIMGSNAGAGSGDFHMYRNARRVELERLDQMEKQAKADEAASEFERTRIERAQREAERTAKRAAKRAKKKSKKKTPKGSDGAHGAAAGDDNGSESDDSGQRGEHKAGSAAKHGSR